MKIYIGALILILLISCSTQNIITKNLEIDFYVTEKQIGFNVDTEKLFFGELCQTCKGARNITITNSNPYPVEVTFYVYNQTFSVEWISIITPYKPLLLHPHQSEQVTIVIVPLENATPTHYTGNLDIVLTQKSP